MDQVFHPFGVWLEYVRWLSESEGDRSDYRRITEGPEEVEGNVCRFKARRYQHICGLATELTLRVFGLHHRIEGAINSHLSIDDELRVTGPRDLYCASTQVLAARLP